MISSLTLKGVGPASEMKLSFGKRLNLITGDNGLGKSFLLDVIWWSITRSWPAEINAGTTAGRKARPRAGETGKITAKLLGSSGRVITKAFDYKRDIEKWTTKGGRPPKGGLTLYALVDGSFAVWDPARNYWKDDDAQQAIDGRFPAYVFTPDDIWNGQKQGNQTACRGFIEDYSNINFLNGGGRKLLEKTLEFLSPEEEPFSLGETTRISMADMRDIPTIHMPYSNGIGIPIFHVSSAIKRILSLAYMLVWAWLEHCAACKLRGEEPTQRITFLIDEIEAHLHPRWQRTILHSLMKAIKDLMGSPEVKLIITTHSPLVMASCEDVFSEPKDRWFDLDYDRSSREVLLTQRDFENQGDAEAWLTSEAFDMTSVRSVGAEAVIKEASDLLLADKITTEQRETVEKKLADKLSSHDPYWVRWKWLIDRKFSSEL